MLQTDIVNEINFSINCIWKQHWSFSLKKKNLYIALIYPKQWIIAYCIFGYIIIYLKQWMNLTH